MAKPKSYGWTMAAPNLLKEGSGSGRGPHIIGGNIKGNQRVNRKEENDQIIKNAHHKILKSIGPDSLTK